MTWELVNCTEFLLAEIANPEMLRLDIAKSYALAMKSTWPTDWRKVNQAIVNRWSQHALEWIKKRAHSGKCFT